MEVVVTTGAIRCAKLQSDTHQEHTNNQPFYRPDALPVDQRTVSEHWRENQVITNIAYWHFALFSEICIKKLFNKSMMCNAYVSNIPASAPPGLENRRSLSSLVFDGVSSRIPGKPKPVGAKSAEFDRRYCQPTIQNSPSELTLTHMTSCIISGLSAQTNYMSNGCLYANKT